MPSVISVPDLIRKKRDRNALTGEEILSFVNGVVTGTMEECQIGAMLMAIYLNGLTDTETMDLTTALVHSGDKLNWKPEWEDLLVDKHSTGGAGDKISLILAPALAACGFKVPMMSGRGLGYTGGTLDKLESIPGFKVQLEEKELQEALEIAGCFIVGTTSSLAPGDKELYKRRDVTSTVENIPLIVASIISKKVAEGTKTLVMDVKVGSAASISNVDDARCLASKLINVSKGLGVQTCAALTRMDTPNGRNVGNSLEVAEAIECLKGNGPRDVIDIVTTLGGIILETKDHVMSLNEGKERIMKVLMNGRALEKFCLMLKCQGVSDATANALCQGDMWSVLPKVSTGNITVIKSPSSGTLVKIDALGVAKAVWKLGAGRSVPDEAIDHRVGVRLLQTQGKTVNKGDGLMEIHHSTSTLPASIQQLLEDSILVSEGIEESELSPIIEIITK